ncbi:MAG: hypothetical protein HN564_03160 [Flavobacteriales bacterium]|jgi:hypothetical protein|nr:hypothetical protein [Flavobacteriales bacterium]
MFVEFSDIPDSSLLWIYGSSKKISKNNQLIIGEKIKLFLDKWSHHGKPLTCSFSFFFNRFIVICLNEEDNPTGGCSMDGLQRLVVSIDDEFQLDLYNRLNVFISIDHQVECIHSSCLKSKDYINYDTLFFDLNILHKSELENWLIPIKNGWCKRFLD